MANMFADIDLLVDRPAIEPASSEALAWRSAADALYVRWGDEVDHLDARRPISVDDPSFTRVIETIEHLLMAIAAHPPALPCHGVAHTIRVLSNALRIVRRDRLDTADLLRLSLAAAAHDMGRLLLHLDTDDLRHADVSAVLLENVREQIDLTDSMFIPVRHAVLMHSARRPDHRIAAHRVIDDVRSADKLDAIDEIGFIRAILYQGSNSLVAIDPVVGPRAVVLYGWWKNIIKEEPVTASRSEKKIIDRARERSRRLGNGISAYRAPADSLPERFSEAVALVEPDANRESIAATLDRLMALPPNRRANWAGLLTTVVANVRRHEACRIDSLTAAANGREDIAPLARLLLAWSHRIAQAGNDLG